MLDATTEAILDRYAALLETLQRRHRFTDGTMLRLAAIALAVADLPADAHDRLEAAAEELKQRGGWTDTASGPVRFVLAAMLVRRGLDAASVWPEVERTRAAMKARRLGGARATISAFLLVLAAEGRTPDEAMFDRMRAIFDGWKADHRWLTGADDVPMAALHASRGEDPETVTERVESTYRALHDLGYGRGDQLQLASHLLTVGRTSGVDAAQRFHRITEALARQGLRIGRDRYDEAALLAVTPGDAEAVAGRALAVRERLLELRGGGLAALFSGLTGDLAFSMAVGVVLAHHGAGGADGPDGTADAAALALAQSALEAQQAVLIASIAATSTVAATGGS